MSTRAFLLAKSTAVSFPIPELAPVITTVLPLSMAFDLQTAPIAYLRSRYTPVKAHTVTVPTTTLYVSDEVA